MGEAHDARAGVAASRRWRALLAFGGAAGLAHLIALSGLDWVWPGNERAQGGTRRPVQVRALVQVSASPGAATRPASPEPAADVPRDVPSVSGRPRRAVEARPPAVRAVPHDRSMPAFTTGAPAATPAEAQAVEEAVDDGIDAAPLPPSYRTLVPPAVELHYEVRRGQATGTAALAWRVDGVGSGYALDLQIRIDDSTVLAQSSEGGFDAAGVAPLRFVDRRAARPAAAANFQRDAALITFSRKAAATVLRPGSQDRLSWMLQLPAIVGADAALREPGAEVSMNVASAGGDVALWVFRCEGSESIALEAGRVQALKYVREPRGAYGTRAEIWLDPRLHHLPVQLRWNSGAVDDGLELRLSEPLPGP